MLRRCRALALAAALLAVPARAEHQGHREAEARAHLLAFAKDWAGNNPQALSAYYEDHGDLINPFGRRAHGRMEIEKLFQEEHGGVFKGSRMQATIESVRMLDDDVAQIDADLVITDAKAPDGATLPPQKYHLAHVVRYHHGHWRAVSSRPYAFLQPK